MSWEEGRLRARGGGGGGGGGCVAGLRVRAIVCNLETTMNLKEGCNA